MNLHAKYFYNEVNIMIYETLKSSNRFRFLLIKLL